jgi:hypothetical protein
MCDALIELHCLTNVRVQACINTANCSTGGFFFIEPYDQYLNQLVGGISFAIERVRKWYDAVLHELRYSALRAGKPSFSFPSGASMRGFSKGLPNKGKPKKPRQCRRAPR